MIGSTNMDKIWALGSNLAGDSTVATCNRKHIEQNRCRPGKGSKTIGYRKSPRL